MFLGVNMFLVICRFFSCFICPVFDTGDVTSMIIARVADNESGNEQILVVEDCVNVDYAVQRNFI